MTTPTSPAALASLDPRTVPLVHGSEVTTTAVVLDPATGATIPMGVIGRVAGLPSRESVRVRLVGRGEVVIARDHLAPRNLGQSRFAITRHQTEVALAPCVLYEATVGSRAWGLAGPDSDHDTRGVLLWPFPWACARARVPDVVTSNDGSRTLWELGRACELGLGADPNTLETLFVPDYVVHDELGQALRDTRDAFVSAEIYGSFGRYALAQSAKLAKSLRLAEHRGMVLEWLRADRTLTLDAVAARLASEALDDGETDPAASRLRAKQYLKQLCRSLHDQGLVATRSFDGLVALAVDNDPTLSLPRDLRPKNAYNLLRIVQCAVQWLRTGEPMIEATGEVLDRLRAIKEGQVDLPTALSWTDEAADHLEAARANTVLPKTPDFAAIDRLLLRGRERAAQRWLDRSPGPWGRDAAPIPSETS